MERLSKLYPEFTRAKELKVVHMMGIGKKMDTFTLEVMVGVNLMTFYDILADQDEVVYIHSFYLRRLSLLHLSCLSIGSVCMFE